MSCSKEPKPSDQLQHYLTSWQQQNYDKMYQSLAISSQKAISKQDFIDRYKAIYSGIKAKHLKVTFQTPKKESKPNKSGEVSLSYHISMDTIGGNISFTHKATLIKEKHHDTVNWYIQWTPEMIFPQLHKGEKVRVNTNKAIRGEILDRNNQGLAINGTVIQIGLVPEKLGNDPEPIIHQVADLLDITVADIKQKLAASWVKPNYFVPIKAISNNDIETLDVLTHIQGVAIKKVSARVYPYKDVFAHLIGYVGPINASELKKLKSQGYSSHDIIGKRGLEELYDKRLRGRDGGEVYIVDQHNHKTITLAKREPVNGENLKLTIDAQTQIALYNQMKNDTGTAVAIQPKTGEVLAMVSTPAFNPNEFVIGMSNAKWQNLNSNPEKPLLNRFVHTYSPGSTFKVITGSLALRNGVLTPNDTMTIPSRTWQKDASWGNYYVKRVSDITRPMNLQDAFVFSDNIFFAKTALEIGKHSFIEGAKRFGIGEPLPFDYPTETSSITRDGAIHSAVQLADSGYGQGQVSLSPLHLALIYSTFIDQGNMMKPLLLYGEKPQVWKSSVVSSDTATTILNDLKQVVNSPYGTAHEAKIETLSIAGKTGTAELKTEQGVKGKENGWFVAMNTDHPQLLVAMMIENVQNKNGSHYVVKKVRHVFENVLTNQ